MKKYQKVSFGELWPLVESRGFFQPSDTVQFSDLVGFHIYADLRLNLDLAAAEDVSSAMRFVDILEDFTAISDKCARLVGARVLEVQGDRIHFLLPVPELTHSTLASLLAFASALTRTAYQDLKPKAGDDWQGFSMAADHGMAVLVPSHFGGGSLVSLGNVANQPAKRLGRGVSSGHLALPEKFGKTLPGAKRSGDWVEIDVNTPVLETQSFFDDKLTESMRQVARAVFNERSRREIRNFAGGLSEGISLTKTPVRTRGMCLRADLDGFSKKVEEAFQKGPQAVAELVQEFTSVLQYPIDFAQRLGRPIIELPWAGDCCTIFIQPAFHETVEQMRASLPVEAGRHWHGIAYENGGAEKWKKTLGSAKWEVGLACGNQQEGGNGNAIVTEFQTAERSFRIIAGWSARRAKDAQETSGISGDDVVIPIVDFQNLEEIFKPLFAEIGTKYRFSNYAKLKNATQTIVKPLAYSASKHIAGISTAIPRPRPYWR